MDIPNISEMESCPSCNGWGIHWNDDFDKELERGVDNQGLNLDEAILQTTGWSSYRDDFWNCEVCNGSGVKKK